MPVKDWFLEWDGGVEAAERGDGDEMRADFGRADAEMEFVEGEPARENGLFRRCDILNFLEATRSLVRASAL